VQLSPEAAVSSTMSVTTEEAAMERLLAKLDAGLIECTSRSSSRGVEASSYLKGVLGIGPQNNSMSNPLAEGAALPVFATQQFPPVPPPPSQPPMLDASVRPVLPPPPAPPAVAGATVSAPLLEGLLAGPIRPQPLLDAAVAGGASPQPMHEPVAAPAPVLSLVAALPVAEETPQMIVPSLGSQTHALGQCRPCAFFHTHGCENGINCEFCHLCGPGEKKKRMKEKRQVRRECRFLSPSYKV
jgi:hypothetical protein